MQNGMPLLKHPVSEFKAASLTPGTYSEWLWLLPSGPDQIPTLQCGETRRGAL